MPFNLDYNDHDHAIEVAAFEVEVENLHNFKELYKRIYDWLTFEDYLNIQFDEPEFYETLYWEKHHPENMEHHIWWRAWKLPLKDEHNKYFKYFFKINYHTLRIKKAEVMHKGKKWSTHDSDTVLRIKAYLILDDREWKSGKGLFGGFIQAIQPRFRKWFYKDKIWFHREFLYKKAFELQNVIKEYLAERVSQQLPPNIYKEKGLD